MTAKTRHGHKAHPPAHGADPGTAHERLNRLHAMPGRAEGAMHGMNQGESGGAGVPEAPQMPAMGAGPPMASGPPGASMGAGPSTDSEEGDQS